MVIFHSYVTVYQRVISLSNQSTFEYAQSTRGAAIETTETRNSVDSTQNIFWSNEYATFHTVDGSTVAPMNPSLSDTILHG